MAKNDLIKYNLFGKKTLKGIEKEYKRILEKESLYLVETMATDLQGIARAFAPVKTGELESSGDMKSKKRPKGAEATITFRAINPKDGFNYAWAMEYGLPSKGYKYNLGPKSQMKQPGSQKSVTGVSINRPVGKGYVGGPLSAIEPTYVDFVGKYLRERLEARLNGN